MDPPNMTGSGLQRDTVQAPVPAHSIGSGGFEHSVRVLLCCDHFPDGTGYP